MLPECTLHDFHSLSVYVDFISTYICLPAYTQESDYHEIGLVKPHRISSDDFCTQVQDLVQNVESSGTYVCILLYALYVICWFLIYST